MPQSIKLKKSSVSGKVPLSTDLDFGELAINYADGKLFYKTSGGAVGTIGSGSVPIANTSRSAFTATAGQTTFTVSYNVGQIDVYLNGVKLIIGSDFTATDGTSIVLASGAAVGDIVEVVLFGVTSADISSTVTNFTVNTLTSSSGTANQVQYLNASKNLVGSSNLAFNGTTLTANTLSLTNALSIGNGGTGATTQQAALNALAATATSGQYLRGNGTNVVMSAIQAADVPTLNQNTTGTAANVTGTVAVANGGTGSTTAAGARTNLGATTVGANFFTLTASALVNTFPRINTDGSVSALDSTAFRLAIGAGTGSGTVTSVGFTGGIVSIATATTTPALTVAGTSGGIPYFSSASTWASSAALAANALVIGGGAGVAPATTTTGTGVLTALGTAVGSAGAFVTNGGALGTPSSGTVTNLTGTASININGTVGATTANTGNFTAVTSTSEVVTGAAGILTRAAATQDGVELIGRVGGTTSLKVTLTPTTLTASRTLTLPDNSGTILTTGAAVTVAQGGTGLTTGTSGGVLYFSAAGTLASSAALAASALVIGGGAGVAPSTTTTGTGVLTALGVAVGTAGAFVTNGGALGTPSSGTVTNLTGTASININGTVGATTPNTGAFTTLSASSTVSGTGFSTYLASPPAIGATAANTGNFTAVTSTSEVVTGAAGILTRAAATQDGVELIGRAGGTTSLKVTLTPTTLTASRTLTLPDNSGTILTTGAAVTIAQGGTGATTQQAALNALAATVTSGQYLRGNGTNVVMSAIQAADVPTLNQNTTGTAANVTGTVAVANGGTGATTLTANSVVLGNGTSAVQTVAPGTSGNVLTSNGTTWVSQAVAAGAGEFTATASGAIAATVPVALNSDGTVSQIQVTGNPAYAWTFNQAYNFASSGPVTPVHYNPTTGIGVYRHADSQSSYRNNMFQFSLNDSTNAITSNATTVGSDPANSGSTSTIEFTYHRTLGESVAWWVIDSTFGGASRLYGWKPASISSSGFTVGTSLGSTVQEGTFEASLSSNKGLMFYRTGSIAYLRAYAFTAPATFALGTAYQMSASTNLNSGKVTAIGNDKFLVRVYNTTTTNTELTIATINSDNTISLSTALTNAGTTLNTPSNAYAKVAYHEGQQKVILMGFGASNSIPYYIIDVSGAAPTLANSSSLSTTVGGTSYNYIKYNQTTSQLVLFGVLSSSATSEIAYTYLSLDSSTNVLSVSGSPVIMYSNTNSLNGFTISNGSSGNLTPIVWTFSTTSGVRLGTFEDSVSTTNKANYIGFSGGTYANAATATVKVSPSVVTISSPTLTVNTKYYVANDGTLTTVSISNPYAGRAVATNKLLIGEVV